MKRFLAASIVACAFSVSASAVPITFTLRGTATGSANGVPFTGVPFSFAFSSDTSFLPPLNRGFEFFGYPLTNLSVSVGGIGNGTFSNQFILFHQAGTSFVILSGPFFTGDRLDIIYPGLATYPFDAAFGPVSVVLSDKDTLPQNSSSSLGNITFTSLGNLTFGAVTPTVPPAPTPMPSTLILTLTGLAGAGLFYKRLRLSKTQTSPVRPA